MNITINKDYFLASLERIAGIIDKKPIIPILADFHFQVEGKEMVVSATNLRQSGQLAMEVVSDIATEQVFCLNAETLMKLLKKSTCVDVDIKLDFTRRKVTINLPDGTYRLAMNDSDDTENFPVIPEVDPEDAYYHAKVVDFLNMTERVKYAAAASELRPAMACIRQQLNPDNSTNFVATDAHRLAKVWTNDFAHEPAEHLMSHNLDEGEKLEILWDVPSLKVLEKFLVGRWMQVWHGNTQVFVVQDNAQFSFTKTDDKYPNVDEVIPGYADSTVMVPLDTLGEVMERMAVVVNKATWNARFKFEKRGDLTIKAGDWERSVSGEESITLKKDIITRDFEFSVNAKYFAEALEKLEYTRYVRFSFKQANQPVVLCSFADPKGEGADEIHMLMPMQPDPEQDKDDDDDTTLSGLDAAKEWQEYVKKQAEKGVKITVLPPE